MIAMGSVVSPAVSRGQMPTYILVEALLWLVALLGSEVAYGLVSLSIAAWNFVLAFGAFRRFFEALEFVYGYSTVHSGCLNHSPVLLPLARPVTLEGLELGSMGVLAVSVGRIALQTLVETLLQLAELF
jgi:hypothetical protein